MSMEVMGQNASRKYQFSWYLLCYAQRACSATEPSNLDGTHPPSPLPFAGCSWKGADKFDHDTPGGGCYRSLTRGYCRFAPLGRPFVERATSPRPSPPQAAERETDTM